MTKQTIYLALGVSRQAHAAFWKRRAKYEDAMNGAESQLKLLRREHPGLGLQKAWSMLRPRHISRNAFCREMTRRGYALVRKRNYVRVTRSGSYRYPNLIKELIINGVNQVWQSDTTYYRINNSFYYITFIIDVYSRQIVGVHTSKHLLATANIAALESAFRQCGQSDLQGLIFHSDGGSQYRSRQFVERLRSRGISSSMCDVALDNAYAERLNGVIKQEYLDHWQPKDFDQLKRLVNRAVKHYNTKRIHGRLPLRSSPKAFVAGWRSDQPGYRYALLIKDGQGVNEDLCPTVVKYLPTPGKYAREGRGQILPAGVKYLTEEKFKNRRA
ncbi:IS3 family transposase [Lewinella sp. 4G2]|uniref:IS3 family transposase n=1 Tax=Lewinella sp. 4G2 TaxID=1803372 RepID=UPI0007E08A91|nr:IS3 family transposase [Lewinella sp. 4G2]OAV42882.1 hypothetical protein A3850_016790 [Lewinella sp. 4G2]OAV43219.1 hypothetical protein A3850_001335 [Lewinella sp. 4G2]OAV43274.1 hypothetical protein A3850_001630 [Lewinella sp. 4G2]OAV43738.1 hypothetical protein A3850_004165 [Lewinella sp. 4G2]